VLRYLPLILIGCPGEPVDDPVAEVQGAGGQAAGASEGAAPGTPGGTAPGEIEGGAVPEASGEPLATDLAWGVRRDSAGVTLVGAAADGSLEERGSLGSLVGEVSMDLERGRLLWFESRGQQFALRGATSPDQRGFEAHASQAGMVLLSSGGVAFHCVDGLSLMRPDSTWSPALWPPLPAGWEGAGMVGAGPTGSPCVAPPDDEGAPRGLLCLQDGSWAAGPEPSSDQAALELRGGGVVLQRDGASTGLLLPEAEGWVSLPADVDRVLDPVDGRLVFTVGEPEAAELRVALLPAGVLGGNKPAPELLRGLVLGGLSPDGELLLVVRAKDQKDAAGSSEALDADDGSGAGTYILSVDALQAFYEGAGPEPALTRVNADPLRISPLRLLPAI